uniref:Uncharacterized protein n=1 Tax=Sarcophilus harrisii TaxID=9305 RepID=A0A7N4NLH9_SARHA
MHSEPRTRLVLTLQTNSELALSRSLSLSPLLSLPPFRRLTGGPFRECARPCHWCYFACSGTMCSTTRVFSQPKIKSRCPFARIHVNVHFCSPLADGQWYLPSRPSINFSAEPILSCFSFLSLYLHSLLFFSPFLPFLSLFFLSHLPSLFLFFTSLLFIHPGSLISCLLHSLPFFLLFLFSFLCPVSSVSILPLLSLIFSLSTSLSALYLVTSGNSSCMELFLLL